MRTIQRLMKPTSLVAGLLALSMSGWPTVGANPTFAQHASYMDTAELATMCTKELGGSFRDKDDIIGDTVGCCFPSPDPRYRDECTVCNVTLNGINFPDACWTEYDYAPDVPDSDDPFPQLPQPPPVVIGDGSGDSGDGEDPLAYWDWTLHDMANPYHLYIAGQADADVYLPYFGTEGPAAADLNLGADTDIYPEDGWRLVARDFGSETRDVTLPHFILYNKYRGILRLLFYNSLISETYSYGIVTLEQPHDGQQAALFTFGESGYFANDFDTGVKQETIIELKPRQWCYADFVIVGYDPNPPTDATLVFELTGVEKTELEASGDITLEQLIKKAKISGKRDYVGAFDTAFKKYQSTQKSLDNIKKTLDSGLGNLGFYKTYLEPVLDSPFVTAVPYLSAAAGLVKAFIGGKPKQVTPMKFRGGLELSGTLTTVNPLHSLTLRVPGAPLSNPDDEARPLYDQSLGIFNLVEAPKMVNHEDMFCYGQYQGPPNCSSEIDYYFQQDTLNVTINPALNDADIDIQAGLVFVNQPVTYSSLSEFSAISFHESLDDSLLNPPQLRSRLNTAALQVTVRPHNGSYDDDSLVITNTYRLEHVYTDHVECVPEHFCDW